MADKTTTPDWYDVRFDPYCLAVGRIAGIWAQLEFIINQAIWELANVEVGVGACLTAQIVIIGSRMRALLSLLDYRGASESNLKLLRKLTRDIEGLGRQRNRWVHDPASLETDTGILKRVNVTADQRLDFKFYQTNIREMDRLHADIRDAIQKFTALFENACAESPPWSRTQYELSPLGIRSGRLKEPSPPTPSSPPESSPG
jgi:hypothetical protein